MTPRTIIETLEVAGEGFLGDISLTFSSGLNCIIGARGTGKTSILELIRYASGQDADRSDSPSAVADVVSSALGDEGKVRMVVQTHYGQRLRITRGATYQHEVIDADTGLPVELDWPVLDVYDLDIFGQNELEQVSVDPDERRALLDRLCGQEILRTRMDLSDIASRLDVNASRLIQLRNDIEALRTQAELLPKLRIELQAAEATYQEQLAGVAAQQTERSALDQLATRRQLLSVEDDLLTGLQREADSAVTTPFPGQHLGPRLSAALAEETLANLESKERLRELRRRLAATAQRYRDLRQQMFTELTAVRDSIVAVAVATRADRTSLEADYQKLAVKLGAASKRWQEAASRRDGLLNQVRTLELVEEQIKERASAEQQLRGERIELIARLQEYRSRRSAVRHSAADRLNSQMDGVRVRVIDNGDPTEYRDFLMDALKGSGMQYTRVVGLLTNQVPPSRLAELSRSGDANTLGDLAGLDPERARRVAAALSEPQVAFRLEAVEVEDSVAFELQMSDGAFAESNSLSQGQRCTTVLGILLVDSNSPLVIDQPEDNLDNAFVVTSIVDVLKRQSSSRQFIFVTHNPNIAVLGESSQVLAMAAVNGRAQLSAAGAWHEEAIRAEILTVMEGGEDAFQRRRDAYGLNADDEQFMGPDDDDR